MQFIVINKVKALGCPYPSHSDLYFRKSAFFNLIYQLPIGYFLQNNAENLTKNSNAIRVNFIALKLCESLTQSVCGISAYVLY